MKLQSNKALLCTLLTSKVRTGLSFKRLFSFTLILLGLSGFTTTVAQVSTLSAWSSVYHNTANASATLAIPAGTGTYRVLVVAVASSQTAVAARTATVTYGGQTLTLAAGDMSTATIRQHTALYYLLESGIDAATTSALTVSFSGGSARINDVWTSVYDYVDQSSPISNLKNYNSGTTAVDPFQYATGITVGENEQAIEVISTVRSGNTSSRTFTAAPTNWTLNNEQTYTTTDGVRNAVATRSISTSSNAVTDVSSVNISGAALASMTGISLNALSKQFRSNGTGTWGTAGIWQQSMNNGSTWVTATTVPGSSDMSINIRNGNTVTLSAITSVNNVSINAGGTLSTGATNTWTLSVAGTTSVSGTLTLSNTAAKSFTGPVTILSGGLINQTAVANLVFGSDVTIEGTLTENGSAIVTVAGTFTNNGIYTSSSGSHTFSGTGKNIGGSSPISIANTAFTGSYVNTGTLTVGTSLSGSGILSQGTNSNLNIGGTSAISGLDASTNLNTVNYTAASAQTIKSTNYSNLNISGGGNNIKTLGGNIAVSETLNVAASTILKFGTTAQTLTLSGNSANTLISTGTIDMSTSNAAHVFQIGATSIASFGTIVNGNASTLEYTSLDGGQIINALTFNNLRLDNSSGINSVAGNLTVNKELITTAGGILDMGIYQISGGLTTVTNNGTIRTQNTGSSPIPTAKTWGGTVEYNAVSGGQMIQSGVYNNLSIITTSGTQTASGAVSVNGGLSVSAGAKLDMMTYQLGGSLVTIDNNGSILTANTGAHPVPDNKVWGGVFTYYGGTASAAQTVATGTYFHGETGMSSSDTGRYQANGHIYIPDGGIFDNGGTGNKPSILDMGDTSTFIRTGSGKVTNNGGTIKFSGASNGVAGFTSGTVDYCGTVNQTIAGNGTYYTYGFLKLSGSGTKSLAGNIWVKRDWVRTGNTSFDPGTYKVTFQGDGNDNYDALISAPATPARNIYGAFGGEIFYDLEINKNAKSTTVGNAAGVNISVLRELIVTQGVLNISDSNIVLVSNTLNTANVHALDTAKASINYTGTGRFIIQRFIDNLDPKIRTWRMLTAPLQSSDPLTISKAWQEGYESSNYANPSASNPWPGFGTQITGPKTYVAGNGFDQGYGSSTYSIKYYDPSGAWGYPANTNNTAVMSHSGWALFVRGDRGFYLGDQYVTTTSTTLEPKGKINVGDVSVNVVRGKWNLIGNPYPSQIDMTNVEIGGNRRSNFELWDPKAFTNYTQTGKYIPFVYDGSKYVVSNSPVTKFSPGKVESGLAIFVHPSNAEIIFHESDKISAASSLNGIQSRPAAPSGITASFRCDLAFFDNVAGKYNYIDGTLNLFNSNYNTSVDEYEDLISSISASTTGALRIAKSSYQLSISKEQPIQEADTIYLNISKLTQQVPHRLAFSSESFDSNTILAYVIDNYTGTNKQIFINDTDSTFLDFTVTADPLSNSLNRFMVVFKRIEAGPLPVNFTTVSAALQQNKVEVKWQVADESEVKYYEIERSADGVTYVKAGEVVKGINSWLDANSFPENNYYRVKCILESGENKYSAVVKITKHDIKPTIELLNNPVTNGIINIQFNNQSKGSYVIKLLNIAGQLINIEKLNYAGGNSLKSISVPSTIPAGIYQLEVIAPDNNKIVKKILLN